MRGRISSILCARDQRVSAGRDALRTAFRLPVKRPGEETFDLQAETKMRPGYVLLFNFFQYSTLFR